jgi:hypothetical protein
MILPPESGAARRMSLPEIPREKVMELAVDMDRNGFGVLSGYVQPADLAELRKFVEAAVSAAGGEYVAFAGEEPVAGTLLQVLSSSPVFVNLLHQIYELGSRRSAPDQSLYQLLRCLKGKSGLKHSLLFHYDSYVVTVLLPVIIPTEGRAGHLVMVPNMRPIRSSYLLNLIDKIILDNPVTLLFLRRGFRSGLLKLKQIPMVPGNLYFFWGYRSMHANEICDPDKIRATALFHFGDPHADSRLRKFTGRTKSRARTGISQSQ